MRDSETITLFNSLGAILNNQLHIMETLNVQSEYDIYGEAERYKDECLAIVDSLEDDEWDEYND